MKFDRFKVEDGKEYIYLVMVEYKDKTLLKIGYTKTIEGRMDTYELHNPDIQLLKIREGTRGLEDYMHKKFEKYKYPKREEWFYYNEEIVNGFDTLEVKNFLDIDKLKNKIINLLKPKSVEELKKLYYERYQKEIEEEDLDKEELDLVITNSFSFINENIENFIDTFDYSEIPLEIDPNTRYQINIPNPISSENISVNLEQILGRQRLKENPWKNSAWMCVKTTSKLHKTTKEEFEAKLKEKIENSYQLLGSYDQVDSVKKLVLAKKFQRDAKASHYKYDYIAVNEHAGKTLVPVLNNLMMVSEMRAFEVQQTDYADRFSVINTMNERGIDGVLKKVYDEAEQFNAIKTSVDKLKKIVELSEELEEKDMNDFLNLITPSRYKEYYIKMGPDRIKANSYQESKLKAEWNKQHQEDLGVSNELVQKIIDYFKPGYRFSRTAIKEKLKEIYREEGYDKTAKASDLKEYLWTKDVKFLEDGKWINGYEIQKKK